MKTKMILAWFFAACFLLTPISSIYSEEASILERNDYKTSIINTYNKFLSMKPCTKKEYMSDINNISVKWLKPLQTSNTSVVLKWMFLKQSILNMHKITYYYLSIIDKKTGKIVLSEIKLSTTQNKYSCKLPCFGEYVFYIRAGNGKQFTKKTALNYVLEQYCTPIEKSVKNSFLDRFYKSYDEYYRDTNSVEKSVARLAKQILNENIVKSSSYFNNKIYIKFKDKSDLIVSFPDPRENDNFLDNQYVIDKEIIDIDKQFYNYQIGPFIETIENSMMPVFPESNRAIVLDAIPEQIDPIMAQSIANNLSVQGYNVTIKTGDEVTLQDVAQLDDGPEGEDDFNGYGVIYYCHHGASFGEGEVRNPDGTLDQGVNFAIGTKPSYPDENSASASPDMEMIGTYVTSSLNDLTGEREYCVAFTPEFIDTYCNDLPFPKSLIYFYSCGTGQNTIGAAKMFLSFYEKGTICGYVGLNAGHARNRFNVPATMRFFLGTENGINFLGDLVKLGNAVRGGDVKLFPNYAYYNRVMLNPPDIDLVVTNVQRSGEDNLEIVITNAGTEEIPTGREFSVGIKNIGSAEYESTACISLQRHLAPGCVLIVNLAKPQIEPSIWEITVDIYNQVPEDDIIENNTISVSSEDII